MLQGRAVCGRCGRHLRARYAARRGRLEACYVCDRAHAAGGDNAIDGAELPKLTADDLKELGVGVGVVGIAIRYSAAARFTGFCQASTSRNVLW